MSDPNPSISDQTKVALQPIVDDISLTEQMGKRVLAAYSSGGKTAVAALFPEAAAVIQKDISDAAATLPVIKAGWKTSEFWLTASTLLGVGIFAYTSKSPVDGDTLAGICASVTAIYAGLRTQHKNS